MKICEIKKQVLKKIKPSRKEKNEINMIANEIIFLLSGQLPKSYKVEIAGSVAKNTFLKGSADIDIFILVPQTVEKLKFETVVKDAVKKTFPKSEFEIKYSEHPYVKLKEFGKKIDLVPAYNIKNSSELGSAVDRSVLHVEYINSHLKTKQKDEVRLFKQFLKAHKLYGAEIKVQGFSGYLCEILIAKYGSFIKLIKAIDKWTFPMALELENVYDEEKEIIEKFKTKNITFVDPVDKNRDVAAVVSDEVLYKLIMAVRRFLNKPSIKFFKNDKIDIKKFKKKHSNLILFSFSKPKIVDDILWGQLRKIGKRTVKYLEDLDFTIVDYYIYIGKKNKQTISILFEHLESELSIKKIIYGPKVIYGKHIDNFKKKHGKSILFLNGENLCAIENRKIRKIKDGLKEFIRTEKNFPSHLEKNIKNGKIKMKIPKEILEEYLFWKKVFRE